MQDCWRYANSPVWNFPTGKPCRPGCPAFSSWQPSFWASSTASRCTSKPAPHPFIPKRQRPLHIGYSKVTNPTTDEHFYFLHHSADIAPAVSLCKKFQRFLCPGKRLSVFTTWLLLLLGAKQKNPHRFARWGSFCFTEKK